MARDFSEAKLQLYRISQLPNDWDAHGAPKYSDRHLSHARYLLSILPEVPKIYPNPGKSIQFTYGNSSTEFFIELELLEDSSVCLFYKNHDGEFISRTTSIHKAPLYVSEFCLGGNKCADTAG